MSAQHLPEQTSAEGPVVTDILTEEQAAARDAFVGGFSSRVSPDSKR